MLKDVNQRDYENCLESNKRIRPKRNMPANNTFPKDPHNNNYSRQVGDMTKIIENKLNPRGQNSRNTIRDKPDTIYTLSNSKEVNRRNSDLQRPVNRAQTYPTQSDPYQNGKPAYEDESTNDSKRDGNSMRIGSFKDSYPSQLPNQKLNTPNLNGNYQTGYRQAGDPNNNHSFSRREMPQPSNDPNSKIQVAKGLNSKRKTTDKTPDISRYNNFNPNNQFQSGQDFRGKATSLRSTRPEG